MRYAVIEIGYNTVKMVIFEIIQDKLIRLHSQNEFVEITNCYVNDLLSNNGIINISTVIDEMQQTVKLLQCDKTICFATSSLRYIKNKDEIINIIEERNEITIDILTGTAEATTTFDGVNYEFKFQTNGIGCDIGDGSTQIFTFLGSDIQESISVPIGCIKLCNMFVSGILPRPSEMEEINTLIKDLFKEYSFLKEQKSRTLYLAGDTGLAMARLNMQITGQNEKLHGYTMKKQSIGIIIDTLRNKHLNGIGLMQRIMPERIHTIIPAMTQLAAICDIADIDEIIISRNGVKEGYLLNSYRQSKDKEKSCTANISI